MLSETISQESKEINDKVDELVLLLNEFIEKHNVNVNLQPYMLEQNSRDKTGIYKYIRIKVKVETR